ncbi:hypothetical protein Barb6XT_03051 [Bacteroidales bacterium Barb6XT]|nr:hypothetical protein Barb6XT_03051 [Bacteroidales bacterium Barb6XT]
MKKYITGIDISKLKLDLCFVQNERVLREAETANTTAAVRQALKAFLKEAGAETSDVPVRAEYTGQYIRPLCCACKDLGIDLWLENPTQIKYGSGTCNVARTTAWMRAKLPLTAFVFRTGHACTVCRRKT